MNETIQKENRKAFPKFLLIMVAAGLCGGIAGYFCSMIGYFGSGAGEVQLGEQFSQWLAGAVQPLILWLLPVLTAAILVYSLIMHRKVRQLRASWDGEEEETPDRIDLLLDRTSTTLSLSMPVAYLFFSLGFLYGDVASDYLILAGELLIYIAVDMAFQRRTVDLIRTMNPEKQGSIFDSHFCRKWQESCDEGEKKKMGEAAMKTFLIMTRVYAAAWAAMIFLNLIFGIGLMPMAVVLILWFISSAVFCISSMKLEHGRA